MTVTKLIIAAAAGIALSVNTASAIFYVDGQDYTQYGTTTGQYIAPGGSFSDFFDIAVGTPDPGYPNPDVPSIDVFGYTPGEMIMSAYATFAFEPANSDPYQVKVDLGTPGAEFYNASSADMGLWYSAGNFLDGSIIFQLQSNGRLDFTVSSVSGDLYLTGGTLYVDTAASYPQVPDGGITVALLGLGCLGLVGVGKRVTG